MALPRPVVEGTEVVVVAVGREKLRSPTSAWECSACPCTPPRGSWRNTSARSDASRSVKWFWMDTPAAAVASPSSTTTPWRTLPRPGRWWTARSWTGSRSAWTSRSRSGPTPRPRGCTWAGPRGTSEVAAAAAVAAATEEAGAEVDIATPAPATGTGTDTGMTGGECWCWLLTLSTFNVIVLQERCLRIHS